jgi:Uma2 family endonuclease
MAASPLLEQLPAQKADGLSPEEFMALPVDRAELVNGEIVDYMPPNSEHGKLAGYIFGALSNYVWEHDLGEVYAEGGFQTADRTVRAPDVAYLSFEDMVGQENATLIKRAPSLAVEVISPNDTYGQVDQKADEYLAAGCQAVWIVNPRWKTVTVKTAEGAHIYNMGESVPGSPALPGFELPVARFFARP